MKDFLGDKEHTTHWICERHSKFYERKLLKNKRLGIYQEKFAQCCLCAGRTDCE